MQSLSFSEYPRKSQPIMGGTITDNGVLSLDINLPIDGTASQFVMGHWSYPAW